MEAGDSTAGDGGKEYREDVGLAVVGLNERQGAEGRLRYDDSYYSDCQHSIEQEGGEVVAGLEKNPDRSYRGDGDVETDNPHPGGVRQVEGVPVHADGDDGNDGDNTEDGGAGHGSVAAIYAEAEDHGDGDEEQGYHSDASLTYALRHDDIAVGIKLGCKGGGNNSGESSYDQNQGQVSEDDEETLCPEAHVGGDDFTDGFAVVADGGDQCTEIVNAAEEDTADEYPEGAGQPAEAEAYSCDRSGDRTGAGDR